MSNKVEKRYTYTGLGFPIELYDVEMIEINGKFHPKIDVRKVADQAIESLVTKKTRFTGNQVRFIRTYFSMSLRTFAKVVNESHMAVKKWENFGDNSTKMDANIESMLRLYIYDHITKVNKRNKDNFYNQYKKIIAILSPNATHLPSS
jgi:DNA-binding transcriptional regulator YiaG